VQRQLDTLNNIAMPPRVLAPQARWTIPRYLYAVTFLALVLHYSDGANAWAQSIWSDREYMASLGVYGKFWDDVFVPAVQCALLLIAASIGLLKTLWGCRRVVVWLGIVLLGSVSAFAVDATFCRYQYSVDIATKEYWAAGGFSHVYYTWWWYNDHWLKVPWYRDAGEFAFQASPHKSH
jgi:hypothetical protein